MKKPLFLALLLTGCTTPAVEMAQPNQIEETRAVAIQLGKQLGGKLKQALETEGPASAVSVCKEIAPQIASDLSRQTGWKVGRIGTRARNMNTGVPDAWGTQALAGFSARMKQGEKPDAMETAEIITQSSGERVLRYAKAIAVQPMCLTCHGPVDTLPEGVKARLQTEYPLDKATGYQIGELRGAFIITRPL